MLRVMQSMSEAHAAKVVEMKKYYKSVEGCYNDITKQEQRYRGEVKTIFKELNSLFKEIDENEKEQNKVLHKMTKDSKNKDMKSAVYFLGELKKAQSYLIREVSSFAERGARILAFVKLVVKNQI